MTIYPEHQLMTPAHPKYVPTRVQTQLLDSLGAEVVDIVVCKVPVALLNDPAAAAAFLDDIGVEAIIEPVLQVKVKQANRQILKAEEHIAVATKLNEEVASIGARRVNLPTQSVVVNRLSCTRQENIENAALLATIGETYAVGGVTEHENDSSAGLFEKVIAVAAGVLEASVTTRIWNLDWTNIDLVALLSWLAFTLLMVYGTYKGIRTAGQLIREHRDMASRRDLLNSNAFGAIHHAHLGGNA